MKENQEDGPDKSGTDISDAILYCIGAGAIIYFLLFG